MLLQRGVPGRVHDAGGVQLRGSRHQPGPGPDPVLQDPHTAGRDPHLGQVPPKDREKRHLGRKVKPYSKAFLP